jgi:hypothetical protein
MNPEQVEHELNNRKGAMAMVVRPYFGTQSDSWIGVLTVTHRDFPMIFQVKGDAMTTIFRADDVVNIEPARNADADFILRLKGPLDFLPKLVTA